jgi:hypothetical protein
MFRGRICKRLRSPASAYVAWWRAGTITLFVALARQATYAGGIDSLESIPELLKRLHFWSVNGKRLRGHAVQQRRLPQPSDKLHM